jgi:glucosamine--fructose-6-phosphate aminotransferase (isomerizing)
MCGIFGYVGGKNTSPQIVLKGLKTLEYRGYDSWGISARIDKKLIVDKHTGKIGKAKTYLPKSTCSIGHTRWATHGGVTNSNAHPHLSCDSQIALVHNGIVENFQKLKKQLKSGHKFKSDTDTEVVAHLIEEEMKIKSFSEAVRASFKKLKGLNAIVVLSSSGQIAAAKNGSPLVLGVGDDEYLVASDPAAVLPYTKKAVFLEDNRLAMLEGSGIKILGIKSGEKVRPKVQNLQWKIEESERGKFKHFMLKEIYEQPAVLKKIASNSKEVEKVADFIKDSFGTFLVACGSASYAALCGVYLFSKIAKRHVNFSIGSEFNYLEDYIRKGTLVIPISQSGESVDVIEPVVRAKKKRAKIVSIVNVLGSSLYRMSNYNLLINAGPEKAVCATKSFTAMVANLIYLSYTISKKRERGRRLLKMASTAVEKILKPKSVNKIKKLSKKIHRHEHLYLIGRGLSYAAALEATLNRRRVKAWSNCVDRKRHPGCCFRPEG